MSHCCPPNAEKYLAPDYTFTGKTHTLADGVEYYESGSPALGKAVILIPDIFGWNGGRTRNIADWLAEEGYYTVVPKLLVPAVDGGTDGDGFTALNDFPTFFGQLRERFSFDSKRLRYDMISSPDFDVEIEPRLHSITNHVKSHGIDKIHLLAFCWGGWAGCHLLATPAASNYASLAIGHPSVQLEEYAFGKSTQELFDRVQKPLLLLPAKGDPEGYHETGSFFTSIKARFPTSETESYLDVEHGFIPRSDLSVPVNKAAVDKALKKILAFFEAH